MVVTAPYGSWASPITPTMLTHAGVGLSEVTTDGADVYWLESRPTEAGRSVIVRRTPDGTIKDVSPTGFNSRTRAHEYGGGAYAVRNGIVISSSFKDQRVYRLDGAKPQPITPEPDMPAGDRYADCVFHDNLIICVREQHLPGAEAVNELVAFPVDGSARPKAITGGHDFISSPRVSPDGRQLTWLTWDHPNMPWDGTELWVADLAPDGTLGDATLVAGGPDESIFQPEWSPDGRLHFISDRTGWGNLYRLEASGEVVSLHPLEAEFGAPQWQFAYRRYGFLDSGVVVALYERDGISSFGLFEDEQLQLRPIDRDVIGATLAVGSGLVWTVAAGRAQPAGVVSIDPRSGQQQVVRSSLSVELEEAHTSRPQPITFPTTGGAVAHG